MARAPKLLDQWGRPIQRKELTEEIAAPTLTGVRSPITGYPGDGLNPERLATILREADAGDPLRYLELAETIEERDLHYVGVLGTRKRSVSQLEITVDAASENTAHQEHAQLVRKWLERDELADELFDILDAVGKGYSYTETIWDTSEGQWRPDRLEWRDPRWFRPARDDLATPLLIEEGGTERPLPAFKFICARIKAKSGLPVRSGIARMATWAWMFKAFTQRDWAIFTQTYGQPLRIGRYGAGATEDDRNTLYRAVANIAGDCAAIIPESMSIEFVEAANLGTGHANYKERSDWIDQQVSKGVLGQTATTDAISGGHAVSQEHRQVQEDIERSDCRQLSAIINRDLVRPWMMLEYGPQEAYPRVRIGRAEDTDVKLTVDSAARMIPFGMRVGRKQMSDIIGIGEPDDDDELLIAPASPASPDPAASDGLPAEPALQAERGPTRLADEVIADAAIELAGPAVGNLVASVKAIVEAADTLEDAETALRRAAAAGELPEVLLASMRQALMLAWLSGATSEADRDDGDA